MRVYFETYGCTLNQSDTEVMKSITKHQVVDNENEADVIVINTCGVKGSTEAKILSRLDELKAQGRKVILAGCLTSNPKILRRYQVSISPSSINLIDEAIDACLKGESKFINKLSRRGNIPRKFNPPIAKIPIQQGCLSYCHFCFTKLARKYQSLSIGEVLRWIGAAIYDGCKELELTGTDLGSYGRDVGSNLVELLNTILNISADFRIRLGMSSPHYFRNMIDGLLEMYQDRRIYKFAHLSVQSGSERVVREMNRSHTVEDWIYVKDRFREKFGDEFTIATDIIVGYPTETEDDFEQTLKLIETHRPDIVNLSKFTPRPGTYAANLRQLPSEVVKRRSVTANSVIKRVAAENNQKHIGKEYVVLVTERMKGRTDFYRQVVLDRDVELGRYVKVYIDSANHTSLFARVLPDPVDSPPPFNNLA
ncbi:MAG: tRNA (N(6)-L-threonylcarbamoyladenosine(37)-C(2))-methylthiotransferase [Candidatus Micrarchaeota archaeon]|nr:tRNA (N(6)-L-threonylcarbamoyladenosine(37)-C(2))-methylthiotransferase [Candidatus Micrarchaeota archaeon]MCX8154290.1 tRNA (N(6)-L-threonylcarbamoyladenosine(37)-C(2))-methylthiotransferase [Candidatus Micrarchaeota archaeon]